MTVGIAIATVMVIVVIGAHEAHGPIFMGPLSKMYYIIFDLIYYRIDCTIY